MSSIGRRMPRSRVETPPVAGVSQRGVMLAAAAFLVSVSGGYMWLVWLRPLLLQLLGVAGN